MNLILPWPPSVNRYWRSVAGRVLISRDGRAYRTAVGYIAARARRYGSERIAVEIVASPPDRRRRDLDNLLKAPLDALQAAGVYADDSQIDRLSIIRLEPSPHGYMSVTITEAA